MKIDRRNPSLRSTVNYPTPILPTNTIGYIVASLPRSSFPCFDPFAYHTQLPHVYEMGGANPTDRYIKMENDSFSCSYLRLLWQQLVLTATTTPSVPNYNSFDFFIASLIPHLLQKCIQNITSFIMTYFINKSS